MGHFEPLRLGSQTQKYKPENTTEITKDGQYLVFDKVSLV